MSMNRDEWSDEYREAREAMRGLMRDYLAATTDSVLVCALHEVQTSIPVTPEGTVPQMRQSQWDAIEVISGVAMERFSLDARVPDTPAEIVAEELASATWCVLHSTWASHDSEVRRWLFARAEMLCLDLELKAAQLDALAR